MDMLEIHSKISDAEWEIMRVIWTKEEASIQDIHDALSTSMDWKAATIQTLVRRLLEKGAIESKKVGKKFIYSPLIGEEESINSVAQSMFDKICARKIGETIASLITQAELSFNDVKLIQSELDKKEPVEEIACNCIPGQCNCKK